MARARVIRRGSGARRRTIWARTDVNNAGLVTGTPAFVDLLGNYLAGDGSIGVGLTVTRVIMHLTISTGGTLNGAAGVLGGLVVSEQQSPTPPAPIANGGADWMDYYWYRSVCPGAVSEDPTTDLVTSYDRDIHAQRRIDETGQTLWLSLDPTLTAGPIAVRGYVSTLLKLP